MNHKNKDLSLAEKRDEAEVMSQRCEAYLAGFEDKGRKRGAREWGQPLEAENNSSGQ